MVVEIPRRITPRMRHIERRFGVPIEELIERKLKQHGTVTAAASDLDVSRAMLYVWMDRLGIVHRFNYTKS